MEMATLPDALDLIDITVLWVVFAIAALVILKKF
jgi:hypothetical protein